MKRFLERAWVEIDLDGVENNYLAVRSLLPPQTRIMAVLKADANNLGDVALMKALEPYQEDWLGVSNLDEALLLREHGTTKPILVLGYTPPALAGELARHHITQTLLSAEYAEALGRQAQEQGVCVEAHIKLDTGMSRIGMLCYDAYYDQAVEACCRLYEDGRFRVTGIFTHIATFYRRDPDSAAFSQLQHQRFVRVCSALTALGYEPGLRHCCNSPGLVNHPEMALDMVRTGTALFGGLVPSHMTRTVPLTQPLTVKAAVSCVKSIPQGAYVGYARTYRAPGPMKVAVVSIGYSDISRIGDGAGHVLISGTRCPVIGSVCMDQLMVDVTHLDAVPIGAEAVLLGKAGGQEISLEDLGRFMDMDPEEVCCHLTKRLPRVYLRNGVPQSWVTYPPQRWCADARAEGPSAGCEK